MSPPILLDLSRLLSRAGRPTPTGIDRIELAYAEHLLARMGERLGFVAMNAAGAIAPLHPPLGRRLIETLGASWRHPEDRGRQSARIGLRAKLSALVPGRPLLPDAARGEARRPVYLTVSHQNLHRRASLARFKARGGAAFVVFVHDLIPMDYPEYARPGQAERHRERLRTIRELADGIVVNSRATADSLAPHLTRDVPVLIAHPGAEFGEAPPMPPPRPGSAPYFVCLGTIEPRKNHLLLLHLWRQLAAEQGMKAPRLALIGRRGWENENIVDMIDRCAALRGLVIEHNALSDQELRQQLAGARALLNPAFVEGYGLPIAEALSLGAPVICSDIPVFREVGGEVPDFLDPLDGPGWRQAIHDFTALDGPRRSAQLDRMARWRAPRWEPHLDAVEDLVDRVSGSLAGAVRGLSPAPLAGRAGGVAAGAVNRIAST